MTNPCIDVHFQTLSLPPPYAYAYTLQAELVEGSVDISLDWRYTDRDELSEEEIWEEGFTPDDDFQWQGSLPSVWKQTLERWIQETTLSSSEALPSSETNSMTITYTDAQGRVVKGRPANSQQWEYQLQELVQGVYEAARREHPLRLRYLNLDSPSQPVQITMDISFLHRSFGITVQQPARTQTESIAWKKLRPLLETLYLPDYETELSSQKTPHQRGRYVDPGDGRWYQVGKAALNPGKKDVLFSLHQIMTEYAAYFA